MYKNKIMCKFCENKDKKGKEIPNEELDLPMVNAVIYKHNNETLLDISYDAYSNDSSFDIDMVINFCPICGRNLNI